MGSSDKGVDDLTLETSQEDQGVLPPLPAEGLLDWTRYNCGLLSHIPIACNRSTADFPLSSPLIEFGEHKESPIG